MPNYLLSGGSMSAHLARIKTAAWMVMAGAVLASVQPRPVLSRSDWMVEEALRLGWDHDPVVSRHLVEVQRRLGMEGSDAALVERARALGLLRSDAVVRARLTTRMRRTVAEGLHPTDAELQSHLDAHPERFRAPDRWEVAVVHTRPQGPPERLTTMTRQRLATLHGAVVAEALGEGWSRELSTIRGSVWLWTGARTTTEPPKLVEVRDAVRDDWARQPARVDAALDRLRGASSPWVP